MTTTEQPDVRPTQIWADNDARSEGRTLRVDTIEDVRYCGGASHLTAICTVLTPANAYPTGRAGHQVRIRVSRMKPTSTGYRLVQDAPEETR